MSRHTIGNKRGSVRGAPPDVYLGFCSASDKPEPWEDAVRLSKQFSIMAVLLAVVGFFVAIAVGLGLLPEEFLE